MNKPNNFYKIQNIVGRMYAFYMCLSHTAAIVIIDGLWVYHQGVSYIDLYTLREVLKHCSLSIYVLNYYKKVYKNLYFDYNN